MSQSFVHLRVHTEYSLSDGMVRINSLVNGCAEDGMPAVAVSDRDNLFALIKFYNACEREGVKPIIAVDLRVADDDEKPSTLVLIARTDEGYANLRELVSRAQTEGRNIGGPCARRDWVRELAGGLIALSGGLDGDVGRALAADNMVEAERLARHWQQVFAGNYYLELHRTGRDGERRHVAQALRLAAAIDCPVVATNDVRFMREGDFEAHEMRVCIHDGKVIDDGRRERRYSQEQYLKNAAQMCELFADIPEAIENSVEIARRCSVTLALGEYFLPAYPIPEGATTESFLADTARAGLEERLQSLFDTDAPDFAERRRPYDERLEFELGVINDMGYPGYFLIVMEFIGWAKDQGIPVGPGRGSGAGSLVAYALNITDIDPLAYDLLFERFLNPERISMPDFDIDFCMDGRDQVIKHVAERYGREAVSQIVTFGTMAARMVVKDVARAQGKPYAVGDRLSKLIPGDVGMTLETAMEMTPELRHHVEESAEAAEIMDMAFKLEGITRNMGRHAGGLVIAPSRITDFSPVCSDEAGGAPMTQFDMIDVEQAGLVKFDLLGLRTLTIIDNAVKSVNRVREAKGESAIDINRIPLDDGKVYKELQKAKTTAIFQLESAGMKDLMKKVSPSRFADIVALVALYRPGPMQLANDFIERKHGRQDIDYLHPSLERVLQDTYGVMLYQEQVMQIAQILAGYTLAGADLLRRAMGKKKAEEMAEQRAVFVAGAMANGVDAAQAEHIFSLMERFAGYGFNKPHSVCYALIAYQTAWLKRHYPAHFMAAVLSAQTGDTDKLMFNIEECREMGLVILPPNVNTGEYRFAAADEGTITYGLGAIKGLGSGAVADIVECRERDGRYRDLYDFCERVDLRRINKAALEALIGSGALDALVEDGLVPDAAGEDQHGYRRALLVANMKEASGLAEQKTRNEDQGMSDLFGEETLAGAGSEHRYNHFDALRCMSLRERLEREKKSLGLYLTGHLIDQYKGDMEHLSLTRIANLQAGSGERTVAGIITNVRNRKGNRGGDMTFLTLDDKTGRVEVTLFDRTLEKYRSKLVKDSLVVVTGASEIDDFNGRPRIRVSTVATIEEMRSRRVKWLNVELVEHEGEDFVDALAHLLEPYRVRGTNGCPVAVTLCSSELSPRVLLGGDWRVKPCDELITSLHEHYGSERVELQYA